MTQYIEHHIVTLFTICDTCIDLLELFPETDSILDVKNLLLEQFEIIDCIVNSKHYGTDSLNFVLKKCEEIKQQIMEYENQE